MSFMKDDVSRRDFVMGLAKVCLGASVLSFDKNIFAADAKTRPVLPRFGGKAKRVIYLFMDGGMSHLDTLDPKPGTEVQGPTTPIQTSVPGILLGEHFVNTSKEMKKIALVRSLTSREGAHERAKYQLHTSYPPLSSVYHPTLGSWILKYGGRLNQELPGFVAVGNSPFNSGYFDNEFDPFRVGDSQRALVNVVPPKEVSEEKMDRRLKLLQDMNSDFAKKYSGIEPVRDYANFYDRALVMMRSKDLEAFDVTQESKSVRDAYGMNQFGQGVLLAKRLVEKDVRFVEVSFGGWDTHVDNFEKLKSQVSIVDKAVSSLLRDLKSSGLLDETIICLSSEFGRTPVINEQNGRDHHPRVFSCLLAGGGILGGQVYGASDAEGMEVRDNPASIMDVNATIAQALGLNPEEETYSPVGRPFRLSGGGKPIQRLFS